MSKFCRMQRNILGAAGWLLLALSGCGDDDVGNHLPDAATADGGIADAAPDAPDAQEACEDRKPLPVDTEHLSGFTNAEDFAFDAQGRYVGVNSSGDLVRITKDGQTSLWVPNLGGAAGGATTAGMRFLANGDLVVAIVDNGSIVRITPDGSVTNILTGLLYPNGLDVGVDNQIYVAENNGARVRRVNPDTGEFEVLAVGLFQPNGVAVGPTGEEVFVGSFGGGVVYRIDLRKKAGGQDGKNSPGDVVIFGNTPNGPPLPELVIPCADQEVGETCEVAFGGDAGRCIEFGGMLDCVAVGPCDGKIAGDDCEIFSGFVGECVDLGAGFLECQEKNVCEGKVAGDECTTFEQVGECVDVDGVLQCTVPDACTGKSAGDECMIDGQTGQCFEGDFGLYCGIADPCFEAELGAVCQTFNGQPGACTGFFPNLFCVPTEPCEGKVAGDSCALDEFGTQGECKLLDQTLACDFPPQPCEGKLEGEICSMYGGLGLGTCVSFDGFMDCQDPCILGNLSSGAACTSATGAPGTCSIVDSLKICSPVPGCGASMDACVTTDGYYGFCDALGASCVPDNDCTGKNGGDSCLINYQIDGSCQDSGNGLSCQELNHCAGGSEFLSCEVSPYETGSCTNQNSETTCIVPNQPLYQACEDKSINSVCTGNVDGTEFSGVCVMGAGRLRCVGLEEAACDDKAANDECTYWSPFMGSVSGICSQFDDTLVCFGNGGGSGGGLDGIGVDACGYVYVTEFTTGNIFRIAPTGGLAELAAHVGAGWIPNMHWGPGIGGFEKNILYVADRDTGGLFGLDVDVLGAPEAFPPETP